MSDTYYNAKYFQFQKAIGKFGGKANLFKFEKYIGKTDDVVDLGCGGGFLLLNIQTTGKKIGIDINDSARQMAAENGIECYEKTEAVPDDSADVLISNHALEHVDNPLYYISEMKRMTKNGGKIVVCVPHEIGAKVTRNDINNHLFTWSPQNLFNLFKKADLEIVSCVRLIHSWMPGYVKVQKLFGWQLFHLLCGLYCRIKRGGYQTVIVANVRKG